MELPTVGTCTFASTLPVEQVWLGFHVQEATKAKEYAKQGNRGLAKFFGAHARNSLQRYLAYSRREAKRNEARKWAKN